MRHPDIAVDETLINHVETPWSGEIEHCVIEGHRVLDEVAFLHKCSRTLIITDFIQKHYRLGLPWIWRSIKNAIGILGKTGGVSLDIKLSVRNKTVMRQSIRTILGWDFDHLIVAHGHCLHGNAKEQVANAFDWLIAQ